MLHPTVTAAGYSGQSVNKTNFNVPEALTSDS